LIVGPVEFKEGVNPYDLQAFQPATWILWTASILFFKEHGCKMIVTSLITDRLGIKTTSVTHEEGRAFDLRSYGIPLYLIDRFVYTMNKDYRDIAAISKKDNIARAVIHHKGHFHCQVRPNAPYQKFVKFAQ
jgi:hypothetical protein